MREIHLRRLETAADHLEDRVVKGDRQRQFDMQSWFSWAHDQLRPADEMFLMDGGIQCGAAACAIGWIAGCPVLQREGFGLTVTPSPVPVWYATESDNCGGVVEVEYSGWTAVEKFFGLTGHDATWLFQAEYYAHEHSKWREAHGEDWNSHMDVPAELVIERIRNLVNTARLAGVDK